MSRCSLVSALTVSFLAVVAVTAGAAPFELAVGVYGGTDFALEFDSEAGTVLGAKVRVLTPVPMLGIEGWYSHFGYADPGELTKKGDLSIALDGDGFDLYGADVLIGGVRGVPGFKWFGVVGVSAPEVKELVDAATDKTEKKRKLGGQLGLGLEITPPVLSLGLEARGTLMFLDLSGDVDDKMLVLTVGANYYF